MSVDLGIFLFKSKFKYFAAVEIMIVLWVMYGRGQVGIRF